MPIINNNGIVYSHIAYYKTPDGVYSHQNISASDVIESLRNLQKGEKPIINPEIFKDKIVFVGSNANLASPAGC